MSFDQRGGELPYVSASIALRPIDRATARAIIAGVPADEVNWAEDYPTPGDVEAAELLLQRIREGEQEGPFGMYEVIEATSDLVVGGIGFHRLPDADGAVEIGYGIVPSRWDQGFGTDAIEETVELAQRHGARLVRARTVPMNVGSRRVLEKAGFSLVSVDGEFASYEIDISF